jgi:poly(3-hydroxybutyrate) depolymerase
VTSVRLQLVSAVACNLRLEAWSRIENTQGVHAMTSRSETKARLLPTLAAVIFLIGCGTNPKVPDLQFPQVPGLAQRQVQFQQAVYPFYVFVPSSLKGTNPLPAVLLIHGGGGKGPDLIASWKTFAEQNGIVLVGPTLPLGGDFETAVAPQLYPMIMDAARQEWKH